MPADPCPDRLRDKVAVVTGASRGIGLATAQRLAHEGAYVVITARGREGLEQALATLPADRCAAVSGKGADAAHRDKVLDLVARRWGRLDLLVNLVGTNPHYGSVMDIPAEAAEKVLHTNVLATLSWVQAAVRHQELRFTERGGAVVNLSSVVGERPSPGIGFYGVSKAAVNQLTRTLAVELGPSVRVNAVAPAVVRTGFSRALYEDRETEVEATYPLGRLGEPADIASVIAFLCSDDAAWITGQVVTVDGGLLAAGGVA